jgi:hypothetical protein
MSHTVTIKTQFRDEAAINAACQEMGIELPVHGKGDLFSADSKQLEGLIVKLPGWRFPVIINTSTGEASYDDYQGRWGDVAHLNRFRQLYATHKATIEAQRKGWLVQRTQASNGTIKLQVTGVA